MTADTATATEVQNPAAASLRTEIAGRLAHDRGDLTRRLVNVTLDVPDVPDAPAGLTKAIQIHNAAVAAFQKRRDALDAATADLANALADPEITGVRLAGQVEALKAERFDVARLHVVLLTAKEPILSDLAEALERAARVAEIEVEKARDRARATLKKAGWTPPAARINPGANPTAEETQWHHEINGMAPVREALSVVENIQAVLNQARHQAAAVDHDVALAGERVVTAWRMIVGKDL